MNKRNLWTIFFLLLFFTVVMGFVAMEEGAMMMFDLIAILGAVATFFSVVILAFAYEDL